MTRNIYKKFIGNLDKNKLILGYKNSNFHWNQLNQINLQYKIKNFSQVEEFDLSFSVLNKPARELILNRLNFIKSNREDFVFGYRKFREDGSGSIFSCAEECDPICGAR